MKNFTKNNKGFTLIELLVVIAIIGLLSSIVLVSLNTARDKANDAAIKAAVQQTRAVATLIYDLPGNSYAGICNGAVLNTGHATYGAQLTQIQNSIRANNNSTNEICTVSGTDAYCVSSVLKTNSGTRFCVDSTGKVRSSATAICA